jgi:hypothetical protein
LDIETEYVRQDQYLEHVPSSCRCRSWYVLLHGRQAHLVGGAVHACEISGLLGFFSFLSDE